MKDTITTEAEYDDLLAELAGLIVVPFSGLTPASTARLASLSRIIGDYEREYHAGDKPTRLESLVSDARRLLERRERERAGGEAFALSETGHALETMRQWAAEKATEKTLPLIATQDEYDDLFAEFEALLLVPKHLLEPAHAERRDDLRQALSNYEADHHPIRKVAPAAEERAWVAEMARREVEAEAFSQRHPGLFEEPKLGEIRYTVTASQPLADEEPSRRPETGPMQFKNDWCGVFIRGDSAMGYAVQIRRMLAEPDPQKQLNSFERLRHLCLLLESSNERTQMGDEVQRMKSFDEARAETDREVK